MSDSGDHGFLTTLPRTPQPAAGPTTNLDSLKGDVRLETGSLIAKGGMGEVFNCTDTRLKRPMAVKHATSSSSVDLERFVREARVQGQLQHPGIVPVHELGLTPEGLPYFTMKRVHGFTLADTLDAVREKNPEALKKHTRRRLLATFQAVCQAVEYAHTQGVLHRDLKPANLMLGDFGEAYVLDWGLAKPIGQEEGVSPMPMLLDGASIGATPTVAGSLMGTPGYMSPELVVGQPATVSSDVFALGSILFELLALERMVPGNTVMEILMATRDGFEGSLRKRLPDSDVAPELDAVVLKACAREPGARFPSVRELEDAVERVLAGERDHELRAEMAKGHALRAQEQLVALRAGTATDESRRRALQEVGRSLALDPKNGAAFSTLLELLQTPPKTTPPEVQASMEASRSQANRTASKFGAIGFAMLVTLVPWFVWMGSTNWGLLGALLGVMTISGMASFHMSRLAKPSSIRMVIGVTAFMMTGALVNVFWIPFVVATPLVIVAVLLYVSLLPRKFWVLTIALGVLALVAPYLTWWLGLMPAPIEFSNGQMIIHSSLLTLSDFKTHFLVIDMMVSTLIAGALASLMLRRTLDRAQERIATQAWNLGQLLPPEAGDLNLLKDTAADPQCALEDFFEKKRGLRLGGGASFARATLHGS